MDKILTLALLVLTGLFPDLSAAFETCSLCNEDARSKLKDSCIADCNANYPSCYDGCSPDYDDAACDVEDILQLIGSTTEDCYASCDENGVPDLCPVGCLLFYDHMEYNWYFTVPCIQPKPKTTSSSKPKIDLAPDPAGAGDDVKDDNGMKSNEKVNHFRIWYILMGVLFGVLMAVLCVLFGVRCFGAHRKTVSEEDLKAVVEERELIETTVVEEDVNIETSD